MSGLLERLQSKKGGRRTHTAAGKVVRTDSAGFESFKTPTIVVETPIKIESVEVVSLGGTKNTSSPPDEKSASTGASPTPPPRTSSPELPPIWLAAPARGTGVLNTLVPRALEIIKERSPEGAPPTGEVAPIRAAVEAAAQTLTREMRLNGDDLSAGVTELAQFLWEYGPLTPLFEDRFVTDIWVDRHDTVVCRRHGAVIQTNFRFRTPEMYRAFAVRLLSAKAHSPTTPHVITVLPDQWRTRVDGVFPPLTIGAEPRLSLRIPRVPHITMYELIRGKTLPVKFGAWLAEAAHSGAAHIFVVGAPGTGRTTFATALIGAIGSLERVATIEAVPEIYPPTSNLDKLVGSLEHHSELIDIAAGRGARRLALGDAGGNRGAALRAALDRGWRGIIGTLDTPDTDLTLRTLSRFEALPQEPLLIVEMGLQRGSPCVERVREVIVVDGSIAAVPTLLSFKGMIEGRRQWDTTTVETPLRRLIVPHGLSPDGSVKGKSTEAQWPRY